jgi:hypothetical protein
VEIFTISSSGGVGEADGFAVWEKILRAERKNNAVVRKIFFIFNSPKVSKIFVII